MKAVGYIASIIGGGALCYLFLSLGVIDVVDGLPGSMEEPALAMPTYLAFISAMMTAVTVVLTAVAIGIGLVAFFTFGGIKDEAQKIASQKVNDLVNEKLSDDAIKARIDEIAFQQGPGDELEEGFDKDDAGDR